MSTRRFGSYAFEAENEDKVLFPDDGLTKGDLIDYYAEVGGTMLRHLADRPLTLQRFPDGIAKQGFIQQQAGGYFPDWVRRERVSKEGGHVEHVVAQNTATLAYLANQGTIELHAWNSRSGDLARPDRLVIDLDPPGDDAKAFSVVRRAALLVREELEELGLAAFVKTTGSRGLHVVAPLRPEADYDAVRAFARELCAELAQRHPDELTVEQRKAKRRGRLYLDAGRNAWAQTAVAPYSVRARPGAPVAAPLEWSEVEDARLRADRWRMTNVLRRLSSQPCPWQHIARHARSLATPSRKLARR